MRRLFCISLLAPLALAVSFSLFLSVKTAQRDTYNYLIVGLDDAAENTDSIIAFSFSKSRKELSLLQIPRDTYSRYGSSYGKINGIYSTQRAKGEDERGALTNLSLYLEDVLGINFDGYFAINSKSFSELVDAVGGISVYIPEGFAKDIYPFHLEYGDNLLSGKEALAFVRQREGYPTADLGRMDAQKIFLQAVHKKLTSSMRAGDILKIIRKSESMPIAKFNASDIFAILFGGYDDLRASKLVISTLPGEARTYKGVSYYIANRASSSDLIERLFQKRRAPFDEKRLLLDSSINEFKLIYEKSGLSYKIFSDGKYTEIIP